MKLPPPPPGLTAGDAARQLGVSVTTLRTWHQRYGLGPSTHEPGQHRRYAPADMRRLKIMTRLTAAGVSAAEAARQAMNKRPEPSHRARGGGHTIAVDRANRAAQGLARAAMRLDVRAMVEQIDASVRRSGIVPTWERLISPVLIGVGTRHATTHAVVDVEHLLSRSISTVLATVPQPDGPIQVLLACAEEEQHSLPLEALAAALAERGCPSRLLGSRTPSVALVAAARRTGPAVVALWSHAPASAGLDQLRAILAVRPAPVLVMAAGPGWPARELTAELSTVEHPARLEDAVALVVRVARPSADGAKGS